MTLPVSRINAYRVAVVARLKATMPALREVSEQFGRFVVEDLDTIVVKAPAIRFAVLKAPVEIEASGHGRADLECAAFVVTEGKDRDAHAWAIAEAIAVTLHAGQLFELVKLSGPSKVQILPIMSAKLKTRNVSVIAVEWRQSLRDLGAGLFDEESHLLKELYVNDELLELHGAEAPDGSA